MLWKAIGRVGSTQNTALFTRKPAIKSSSLSCDIIIDDGWRWHPRYREVWLLRRPRSRLGRLILSALNSRPAVKSTAANYEFIMLLPEISCLFESVRVQLAG